MTTRLPIPEFLIGCGVLVTGCISIWLTRVPGGIALFWPSSALAAALLIRLPRIRWISAAIFVMLAFYLANALVAHRTMELAAWFTLINGVETSLMVAAFRFAWRMPFPDISMAQASFMTLILGIAIPGLAASAGGLLLHLEFDTLWLPGTLQWWSSHTIGACLIAPSIILFSTKRLRELTRKPYLFQNVFMLIAGLVGCYLAVRYVRFPFVAMGLLLMVTAFKLGGFGTSLMSLGFGLVITNLWILGVRPIGLDPATPATLTLLGLPVVALLATVMPPIAVGLGSDARRAASSARRRAEESLAAERERLKTTLGSLNDAVITTDASFRITYINPAAGHLFGFAAVTVMNRRIDEVIHLMDPRSSIAASNLIGLSALHGEVFRRDQPCILHRPDGSVCYVIDVVSPVLDQTGALTGMVIVFRDATADVDRDRDLQHRAMHDPLTGLDNRTEFNLRLRSAFAQARHLGRAAAIIAIDLDRFKAVNDTGGHAAGDAVLCKVASICRNGVRSSDAVARLGGDEFAVILENCEAGRADLIAKALLHALNPLTVSWGGSDYTIGASLGLAMTASEMTVEGQWLEAADRACYLAKKEGRGRLHFGSFPRPAIAAS